MTNQDPPALCPDHQLRDMLTAIEQDPEIALTTLSRVCREFPADARLRFLFGSMLASEGRYADARAEMREALRISPGYALARFQLGLLELSSGDASSAEATWRALDELPSEDPLRVLSAGLICLAHDQFPEAVALLERGIDLNTEHPPINDDMRLLISAMRAFQTEGGAQRQETSAAHMLLQQYKGGQTRH